MRIAQILPQRPAGPLLESVPEIAPESPLAIMTVDERLAAD